MAGHAITQVRVLEYRIVKKQRFEDFLCKDFTAVCHPETVEDTDGDNVEFLNHFWERIVPEISLVGYEVLLRVQNKQALKEAMPPEELATRRREQGFRYAYLLPGIFDRS